MRLTNLVARLFVLAVSAAALLMGQEVITLVPSGLSLPSGVAVDQAGNVYIADTQNNAIKAWVAATQQVITVVPATAGLNQPASVAVDQSGNIYIADSQNNAIKEWTLSTQQVTTLVSGLSAPLGVAVDANGNVYFADSGNNAIKEWNVSTQAITTLVSSGLNLPNFVALDASQNVYFTDTNNGAVKEWNAATQQVTTLVSSNGLYNPEGVAVDGGGNVYFSDYYASGGLNTIQKWTAATGLVTTLVGSGLNSVQGVAVDGAGNLYFADYDAIKTLTLTAAPVLGQASQLAGPGAGSSSEIVTMASGFSWNASTSNSWLHITNASGMGSGLATFSYDANTGATRTGTISFTGTGSASTLTFTQAGAGYVAAQPATLLVTSGLNGPGGVAVDNSGNIYVADSGNNAIKEWNAVTQQVSALVATGLNAPAGVAVDAVGNVYIADSGNNAIKEWNAVTQQVTTLVASGLNAPAGVAVDAAGNLYIADTGNNAIKEWNAALQQLKTLVGSGLNGPAGVAVDAAGNLYMTDAGNNAVKEWSAASQQLSTLMASGLNGPTAIAVDGAGNLYIADSANKAIKEWNAATQQVTAIAASVVQNPRGMAVDASGNVYFADANLNEIAEIPLAFVSTTPLNEPNTAGTDQTLPVLPVTVVLNAASDQSWLTIGSQSNGVVNFAFSANSATSARVAHISVLGQSITVNQAAAALTPQTITFGPIATQTAGATVSLNATATSGLPVVFTSTTTAACTVSGSVATLLTAGTCSITASQPGDGVVYAPAAPRSQSFSVVATQTISFGAIAAQASGTALALTATASSGLTVSFASSTPAVCLVSGSSAVLLNAGICTVVASQAGNSSYATATPVSQSFSVTGQAKITTVSFTAPAGVALGTPIIFTEGVPSSTLANPDFTLFPGGSTCAGSAGGSCTVSVKFTAQRAGLRRGAVKLVDSNNNVLAVSYVYGSGTVSQLGWGAGTPAILYKSGSTRGVAVDGAGDVFLVNTWVNQVFEITPGGTLTAVPLGLTLNTPFALALDGAGNLYVADAGNNRIVELPYGASSANVLNISGLTYPQGVAVDGSGNLFIANSRATATSGKGTIVELTVAGTQSTVLSSGLSDPAGIAIDAAGDLFIADWGNNRVLELTPSGTQTSLGTGLANASAVAVDGLGDVFIVDENHNQLVELPAGSSTQLTVATGLVNPFGLAVDGQGDIFIANSGTATAAGNLVEVPNVGMLLTQSITFNSIPGQSAGSSTALTATASSGLAVSYVSSTPAVCSISGTTAVLLTAGTCTIVASQAGNSSYSAATPVTQSFVVAGAAQVTVVPFTAPAGVALGTPVVFTEGVPSSSLASPDFTLAASGTTCAGSVGGSCTVSVKFTPQYAGLRRGAVKLVDSNNNVLATSFFFANGTVAQATWAAGSAKTIYKNGSTRGVTVDGAGNVFVVDTWANGIYKVTASGSVTAVPLGLTLNSPFGVALDAAGNLYVADGANNRILELPYGSSTAIVLNITGLNYPEGIAVDGLGNLLIANTKLVTSSGTGSIIKVAAGSGAQSTLIGTGLNFPSGVATDAAGDLFIADKYNNRVLEVQVSGAQLAIGSGLSNAFSVVVDGTGDVFIADENNNRIVEVPATSNGAGTGTQVVVATNLVNPSGLAIDGRGDLFIAAAGTATVAGSLIEIPVTAAMAAVPLSQTISFGTISAQRAGGALTLTATASSGLAVSYTSSTSAVCSVSGSTATLLAAGTCTIAASQPGNSSYAAATPVLQSFTVSAASATTVTATTAVDSTDLAMTTFKSALLNANVKVVRIALVGDSFWTCGGGTIQSDCPAAMLQQYLQTNFGNAGSGLVNFNSPTGYLLNHGTGATVLSTLGAAQCASPTDNGCSTATAVTSLYRLPGTASAAFGTSSIGVYGSTLKLYGATYTDSGSGMAVSVDGGAATTCFAATSATYTPAVCTINSNSGWHYVTITGPATGAGYLYGAEWLTGTSGVVVDNYAHGACMTSCFGEAASNELAYVSLVGTPSLVIHLEGINDAANNISASVFQSQYQNQGALFAGLTPSPSQLIVDESYAQNTTVSATQATLRPIEQQVAFTLNAAYLSLAEAWGSWANANASGFMSTDGTHLNDQGHRAMVALIEGRILGTFGASEPQSTYIDSATGSIWLGNVPPNVDNGQGQVVAQTAVGVGACSNSFAFPTGYNSCFGYNAGIALTTGQHNSLFGRFAGGYITTGNYNVGAGDSANFGAATSGSVQLGQGTNSNNNTQQFQNINYLSNTGHFYILGGASVLPPPVVSACGASPVLSSDATDAIGTVTIGAGGSGCVVTFVTPFAAPGPHCVLSSQTFSLTAYSESTTALTVTGTGTFDYHCLGK